MGCKWEHLRILIAWDLKLKTKDPIAIAAYDLAVMRAEDIRSSELFKFYHKNAFHSFLTESNRKGRHYTCGVLNKTSHMIHFTAQTSWPSTQGNVLTDTHFWFVDGEKMRYSTTPRFSNSFTSIEFDGRGVHLNPDQHLWRASNISVNQYALHVAEGLLTNNISATQYLSLFEIDDRRWELNTILDDPNLKCLENLIGQDRLFLYWATVTWDQEEGLVPLIKYGLGEL